MKGWTEMCFNDFIKLNRGFDLPNNKIKEGAYPIVASTTVKGFHEVYKVKCPGVVTGRSGSLGVVQYVKDNYWPLNTSLYVKDFKGNNPKYVYYFLQTMHLENFDSGAGVPTLNQNHLHKVKLFVPDLPTQKKIADILSAYDDLIEVNKERIKILEETARELYKEWFVRMRFPGYKKAKFNKGIPEGWEVKTLNHLSTTNSKTLKTKQERLSINYIDISSVSTSRIDYTTEYLIKDAPGRAKRIVNEGDTIFSTVRPENRAYAFIINPELNTIASTGFAVLSPNKKEFAEFIYFTVSSESFIDEMSIKAKGSAYPQVSFDDVGKYKCYMPVGSSKLFERFHALVNPMFLQIHVLQQQNTELSAIRDRLLPRLISGKLQVKA